MRIGLRTKLLMCNCINYNTSPRCTSRLRSMDYALDGGYRFMSPRKEAPCEKLRTQRILHVEEDSTFPNQTQNIGSAF